MHQFLPVPSQLLYAYSVYVEHKYEKKTFKKNPEVCFENQPIC